MKKQMAIHAYRFAVGLLQVLFFTAVFGQIWMQKLNRAMRTPFEGKGNLLIVLVYALLTLWLFRELGGFGVGSEELHGLLLSQILATFLTNVLQTVLVVLVVGELKRLNRIARWMSRATLYELLFLLVTTTLFTLLYHKLFSPYRMVQVYGDHGNRLVEKMNARSRKYRILAQVSCHEPVEHILRALEGYDAVLLNDIPSTVRNVIVKFCFDKGIRVYYTPKISDILVKGSRSLTLFDTPLYLADNLEADPFQRAVKRIFDIVISLALLILTSPVMLITAIAIKAYDGGPVLFRQERCTLDRRVFTIYKFRSMVVDAEQDGKPLPASEKDWRITPVGKFIRETRIDELPQFFNILRGEMSLVGPRPERIEHVEKYSKKLPEFSYRMKVKGGLTGYAQVYGKYNTTAYDKLKLDLIYIANFSLLLDLKILVMTAKVIFLKESTEAFTEEAIQEIREPGGKEKT